MMQFLGKMSLFTSTTDHDKNLHTYMYGANEAHEIAEVGCEYLHPRLGATRVHK